VGSRSLDLGLQEEEGESDAADDGGTCEMGERQSTTHLRRQPISLATPFIATESIAPDDVVLLQVSVGRTGRWPVQGWGKGGRR